MDSVQRSTIESERVGIGIAVGYTQRAAARRLKDVFDITLADVPLATVYNHIRRFDKRNAATKTAGLAAVQEPATVGV